MVDDNDKKKSDSIGSGKKNLSDDIPLWLQGLEDHEDTDPLQAAVSSDDTEESEAPQDSTEQPDPANQIPSASAMEEIQAQDDPPDWLSELPGIDSTKPPVLEEDKQTPEIREDETFEEPKITGEELEEIEINPLPPEELPEEQSFIDRPPADEAGEQDLPEDVEITEPMEDEMLDEPSQDEDLPPWLQEMIAKPEEGADKHGTARDAEKFAEESTEPIVISGGPPPPDQEAVPDEVNIEEDSWVADPPHPGDEFPTEQTNEECPVLEKDEQMDSSQTDEESPAEWMPEELRMDEAELTDMPSPSEETTAFIEGDTQPINVEEPTLDKAFEEDRAAADLEPEEMDQKEGQNLWIDETESESAAPHEQTAPPFAEESISEQEAVDILPEDLPQGLIEAQRALSGGEISQAVLLIRNSEGRSSHLQQVQTWLMAAVNTSQDPGVELWELLGDITFENGQPDLAFNAYAKALQSLLASQEVNNGIS